MQQGSNPNTGSGFGSGAPASSSGFGAPSQPASSAPPNTFRPQPQSGQTSAFSSGLNNGPQGSGFGTPRPLNHGPRPQLQHSGHTGPRPFAAGQPRPQQTSFHAARPFMGAQQPQFQQQQQQQQSSTFSNKPRPYTSRSTAPGVAQGQEGRPPNPASYRGGRGGSALRPVRPFVSHPNVTQQTGPNDGVPADVEAGFGKAHSSRPRPRPFANKSTTFNAQPQAQASASAFGAALNGQASTPASAFGAPTPTQNVRVTGSSAFNRPNSSLSSPQTMNSLEQDRAGSGSTAVGGSAAPTMGRGNTSTIGSNPAFGSLQTSSASGDASVPVPSSAFGGNANASAFGAAFSTSQGQPSTASAGKPAVVTQAPSNTLPAASAAPTSSFSNFLRKDRNGASTPADGSGSPFGAGSGTGRGTEGEDELRKKRFDEPPKVGNRFLELKGGREALRNAYIKSGVLPDPDKPTDLALAVKLVGTCQDMCPEFEREEREFQKELDPLEVYPGTDRVDPRIAVKIYRRPAAGRELPLPEDVRPPPVLKHTLDYLFHVLLPANPNDPKFTAVQGFLWNRTRAVRQDFIVQSEGGPVAIECHERIARYHILCLHWRGGPGAEGWSEQQELEQLRKTMRSLIEFYDDHRRKASASASASGGQQPSPNESEFRAYNLLLHLRDPETLREAELLPGDIFCSPLVQTALNLRQLAQRSNNLEKRGQPRNTEATLNFFSKFFAELRKPSVNYLMACLAENSFSSVRIGAVKAMSKAYMAQHRALPIERVQHVLGMDSSEQVESMATQLGLELEFDEDTPVGVKIHRNATINEDKPLVTPFSTTIVEAKRGSYTSADVVDGRASGASAMLPSTQTHSKASTAATAATAPSAQPFAGATSKTSVPAFGLNTPRQSASALAASTSVGFGQHGSQQDTSKSSAFGTASSSKIYAKADAFKPASFDASNSSETGTSTPNSTFGAFSGFGSSISERNQETSKTGQPDSRGYGKDLQHVHRIAPEQGYPFGANTTILVSKPSDTESKAAAEPNFSFGQPAATSKFDSSSTRTAQDGKQAPSSSPAHSFSFGAASRAESGSKRPSMPSFFAASSGAKAATEAAQVEPETAAATEQSVASPTAANQKRRASDAKVSAALQAAAAVQAEADAKAQSERKEAARTFAIQRAFKALSDEVIRSAAAKTAAKVVQQEELRRRAATRNELLGRVADQLWQRLADEHAAEIAEEASRVAAAEVFHSRSSTMRAWQRWTEILEDRRDRERQRQRLESIRSEIRRRNILGRSQTEASTPVREPKEDNRSSSGDSPISQAFSIRQSLLTGERTPLPTDRLSQRLKRKLVDDPTLIPDGATEPRGDADLIDKWTRIRRQRSQLWAEGSMLERLADHIEKLLSHFRPADLDRLVVLYSGAPDKHVASSWLRVKFGFSPSAPSGEKGDEGGRDVLEIDFSDGSQFELVDITASSTGSEAGLDSILPATDEHSQAGLVVFETNPAVAQAKTSTERQKLVARDRKRLEEIADSNLIKTSQLACSLLVITWGGQGLRAADADDDVEMSDVGDGDSQLTEQQDWLGCLGLDPSKAMCAGPRTLRSTSTVSTFSPVVSHAFERVGMLELDDASVSVENTLAALLARIMPDLSPNPKLYLNGPRRPTLEDLVLELYEQWARTSTLLIDLLSGLPSAPLSPAAADVHAARVEQVTCKSLRILTALANHILRTILSLSRTCLEDEHVAIELPVPSTPESGTLEKKVVGMALAQIDALTDVDAHQKLSLRSRLLSSLPTSHELKDVLATVISVHLDELLRLSLDKLGAMWTGYIRDAHVGWGQANEMLATLCSAAVDEVVAETRSIWAEYRAAQANRSPARDSPTKRIRLQPASPPTTPPPTMAEPKQDAKSSTVNELRELIARTKRFLDHPAS